MSRSGSRERGVARVRVDAHGGVCRFAASPSSRHRETSAAARDGVAAPAPPGAPRTRPPRRLRSHRPGGDARCRGARDAGRRGARDAGRRGARRRGARASHSRQTTQTCTGRCRRRRRRRDPRRSFRRVRRHRGIGIASRPRRAGKLALAASTTATPVGGSAPTPRRESRRESRRRDGDVRDARGDPTRVRLLRRHSAPRPRTIRRDSRRRRVRASAAGPRRGSVLDDDIHADVGAEDEDGDGDATGSGSTPRGGEDDPWYAAFRAAGMRGANAILSRASRDDIFRFLPANDGVGVAGVAFARRLREATTRERDETRDGDEDVVFVAGGDRDDVARPGATPPPPRMTPELPPSAIPLPPSRPSVAAGRSDARGGPPPPPVAGRRLPDPGALIGGGVGAGDARDGDLGEGASLVSVLLPPAPTSSADGLGVGSLSKIFVVAYSRRSADYVTYSCRLPKGRSVA